MLSFFKDKKTIFGFLEQNKTQRELGKLALLGPLLNLSPIFSEPSESIILLLSVVMILGGLSGQYLSLPAAFLRLFREFSEHVSISCNLNRFFFSSKIYYIIHFNSIPFANDKLCHVVKK